jgi:signal transduction histidine kinase
VSSIVFNKRQIKLLAPGAVLAWAWLFVRLLVELHGGKIWAESQLNQGTQFRFELPVVG